MTNCESGPTALFYRHQLNYRPEAPSRCLIDASISSTLRSTSSTSTRSVNMPTDLPSSSKAFKRAFEVGASIASAASS